MKKYLMLILFSCVTTAGIVTLMNQNKNLTNDNLSMLNIEALSDDNEEGNVTKFSCEGNCCKCAVGDGFTIHGHLKKI